MTRSLLELAYLTSIFLTFPAFPPAIPVLESDSSGWRFGALGDETKHGQKKWGAWAPSLFQVVWMMPDSDVSGYVFYSSCTVQDGVHGVCIHDQSGVQCSGVSVLEWRDSAKNAALAGRKMNFEGFIGRRLADNDSPRSLPQFAAVRAAQLAQSYGN
jgi:hypothetical protein